MHIKKGDKVKLLSGRDRGKEGVVVAVDPVAQRLTVEGLNLYKKRARPKKQGQKGETVLVARPIVASRAMLICGSCKLPARVGWDTHGDRKIRICKRCGATT